MRNMWRWLVILLGVMIVAAAIALVMLIAAGRTGDLYNNRLKLAFNAAALDYAPGDPARTIVATHGGAQYEVDPDRYTQLSFYMRERAVGAYLPVRGAPDLTLVICDTDRADIYRRGADDATIVFTSAGKRMKVRAQGEGLWASILKAATGVKAN
jgi:hypothetical protein